MFNFIFQKSCSDEFHQLILQSVKKNSLFFLLNVLTSKIAGYVPAHPSWKTVK